MNQGLLDSSRIEQYILGGILCESICMADCVSQGVLPSHFAHPLHRKIYETAMSGYQKRNEVVMEDLLSSLQMDPDGSVSPQQSLSYMTNLMDGYVGYSQYDHYIRLLLEKAQRRRLMESAQKILSLCEQEEDQDVLLDISEPSRESGRNSRPPLTFCGKCAVSWKICGTESTGIRSSRASARWTD